MSVKIYWALRADVRHLNQVIDWFRQEFGNGVIGWLETLMANVKEEDLLDLTPTHIRGDGDRVKKYQKSGRLRVVLDYLHSIRQQTSIRYGVDLGCGINLWFHDGDVYVIPVADNLLLKLLSKLDLPDYLEDFSYWDNTDPPLGVDWDDWVARGKTWEKICTGPTNSAASHNVRRLYHEIINPEHVDQPDSPVGPWAHKIRLEARGAL